MIWFRLFVPPNRLFPRGNNYLARRLKHFLTCGNSESTMDTSNLLEKFRELSKNKEKLEVESNGSEQATKPEMFHKGLTELDVGMEQFVGSHDGFKGIIKHRFSDFLVNEIDEDGNEVHLTSLELPSAEPEAETPEAKVLTKEQVEKIKEIANSNQGQTVGHLEIEVTDSSKEDRGALHKEIKALFSTQVCSNTVEKDGKKFIVVKKSTNKDRLEWPANRGKYLHFTLFKVNSDTTETVNKLSKWLRTKPSYVSYAGTKDKRGKTTQRISIKFKTAEMLMKLNMKDVTFGNFSYSHKGIRLGQLQGNKFNIVIRNVEADDETIHTSCRSLKENGFINYYGLQRFGVSASVPTHLVGKALIMKNYKQAVELLLKPRPNERCNFDVKNARDVWWATKDPSKAIQCLRRSDSSLEGRLLYNLKKCGPNSYGGAFLMLPRNTVQLYQHAYQSLVWNKIVSRRIKTFGLQPLEGDLVLVEKSNENLVDETKNESEDEDESDKKTDNNAQDQHALPQVRFLTKDDLSKENIIYDVVYPLPSFEITYPKNEIGDWYKEIMTEDGVEENRLSEANYKTLNLSGDFRKMLQKPDKLHWSIVKYNDPDVALTLSDVDKLENVELTPQPEDSQYKAVILEFSVEKSVYATMALREAMKQDTSVFSNATSGLNHKREHDQDSSETAKKLKSM